jgi:hypothetical protein
LKLFEDGSNCRRKPGEETIDKLLKEIMPSKKERREMDPKKIKALTDPEEFVYQMLNRSRSNNPNNNDVNIDDLLAISEAHSSVDLTHRIR